MVPEFTTVNYEEVRKESRGPLLPGVGLSVVWWLTAQAGGKERRGEGQLNQHMHGFRLGAGGIGGRMSDGGRDARGFPRWWPSIAYGSNA
jgi:hypothetical protein